MIAGLISTLTQSAGIVVDKIGLSRKNIPIPTFIPTLFLFLCLFTIPALFLFGGIFWHELLSFKYIALYILMVVVAFIWNILYYHGVKAEKVSEFELILMLNPLLVVLFATIFFKEERELQVLLSAVIASLALFFAHLEKEHIHFSKASVGLLVCVLLMSFETVLNRYLLDVISPGVLYFSRTLFLFLFFAVFYFKKYKYVGLIPTSLIILTSFLGAIQFVARFYGYLHSGVVITTLILTSAPILVYLSAYTYFRERIKKRTIIAGVVILICIIWATLFRN